MIPQIDVLSDKSSGGVCNDMLAQQLHKFAFTSQASVNCEGQSCKPCYHKVRTLKTHVLKKTIMHSCETHVAILCAGQLETGVVCTLVRHLLQCYMQVSQKLVSATTTLSVLQNKDPAELKSKPQSGNALGPRFVFCFSVGVVSTFEHTTLVLVLCSC